MQVIVSFSFNSLSWFHSCISIFITWLDQKMQWETVKTQATIIISWAENVMRIFSQDNVARLKLIRGRAALLTRNELMHNASPIHSWTKRELWKLLYCERRWKYCTHPLMKKEEWCSLVQLRYLSFTAYLNAVWKYPTNHGFPFHSNRETMEQARP